MIFHISHKNFMMTMLFFLALGASFWLMHQSFLSLDKVGMSRSTTPDAFMTDADYISFNPQGQWSSRLHAARITHYPERDTSILEVPKMISRSSPLTWIITANKGIARNGLKIIDLVDQVQIDRIHAQKGKTLTLNTTTLTAYPEQKLARTDRPVTIVQPDSTVHATGLTADLNTGDIHLLSQVRGIYSASLPQTQ
jgi:lipopolysaccharide export system protein LptC